MPRDITPNLMRSMTQDEVYDRDFKRAWEEGKAEAAQELRKLLLDHLEQKYMTANRTTPEARAILKVTRDISLFLNTQGR